MAHLMALTASDTAVSKPKERSITGRSLSMVLGTQATLRSNQKAKSAIKKIRVQPETHASLCGGGVDGSGKPMRAVAAHDEEHSEIQAAHTVEQRGHLVVAAACGADC